MADFYNKSTLTYDSATTPYNGAPIVYQYAGNIPIVILPKYNLQTVKYYPGRMTIEVGFGSGYHHGIMRQPFTTGMKIIMAPSSTSIIRRYLKVKDPVRTAGCPQCGTYLYNGG